MEISYYYRRISKGFVTRRGENPAVLFIPERMCGIGRCGADALDADDQSAHDKRGQTGQEEGPGLPYREKPPNGDMNLAPIPESIFFSSSEAFPYVIHFFTSRQSMKRGAKFFMNPLM